MQKTVIIDWAIPISVLLVLTALFRIFPWDIQLQSAFYQIDTGWWFMKEHFLIIILDKFGYIPALIMSLLSIFVLIAGFRRYRFVKFRKIALLFLLTLAIGPGLIVHGVFKEHWGRPRPHDIIEFGGTFAHKEVLQPSSGRGKSFPSGHASLGFMLLVPYFFLRKSSPKIALSFLALGLGFGILRGVGRMAQGAHFATDVLWSAGLVYLTGLGMYYLLKMNKGIYWSSQTKA